MGRRSALGLAALALVAGLAWWLAGGHTDGLTAEGDERTASPPATASEVSAGALTELPDRSAESEIALWEQEASAGPLLEPAAAPADRAVLIVTLLRAGDDTPIASTHLRVWAWNDPANQGGVSTGGRTTADGTLRLEFPWAVTVHHVEAPPGEEHGYADTEVNVPIVLGEVRTLVVHTSLGAVVRGRVVDEKDQSVPGALVSGWASDHYALDSEGSVPPPQLRTQCDTNGEFELHGVGRRLVLMPQVDGQAVLSGASLDIAGTVPGGVVDGALIEDVTLVVGPGVMLRGRVIDPIGAPMTDLWVQAGHRFPGGSFGPMQPLQSGCRTDANGTFAIGPIAPRGWWVSTHREPYRPWGETIEPDGTELLIRLELACSLSGVVYGADGAPLDGATVTLRGATDERDAGGAAHTETKDGHFEFGSIVPTKGAGLAVSAAGHAVQVVEPLRIVASPPAPLELRLEPERVIAGRVVDEHDQPVPGAEVSIRGDRELADWPWNDWTWEQFVSPRNDATHSDSAGGFRFDRLYDGLFELTVHDPRNAGLQQVVTLRSGSEDLVVRLDPDALRHGVVVGTVRDALTGDPLREFTITLAREDIEHRSGERVPRREFHDEAGSFEMQGFEPGRWSLGAHAEGYSDATLRGLELRDGQQRVEVTLFPSRSLGLRVVDQVGEPVPGVYVSFEDAQGGRIDLMPQPMGHGTIGMTDAAGELAATGLPADRITVVLKVALVPRAAVGTTRVRRSVDLRVQPTGTIQFAIERNTARCLVLSLHETDVVLDASVFDTDSPAVLESLRPLMEQDALQPVRRPITVTLTAADGTLVDTARCEPNPEIPEAWRVTSSVCSSEGEPTSWLAVALPAGPSRAAIAAEGYEPVTLELPAGDGHLRRLVILRKPAGH